MSIIEWLRARVATLSPKDRAVAERIEKAESLLRVQEPARALERLETEVPDDQGVLARFLHVKIRAALALRDLLALESMSLHAETLGRLLPVDARELLLAAEAIGALSLARALAEGISAAGEGAGEDLLRLQKKKERRLLDEGALDMAREVLEPTWTDVRLVGWGRTSFVVSAVPEEGGETSAFKFLGPASWEDATGRARFAREVDVLTKLRHPNVLEVRGAHLEEPPYMQTEFFPGADLRRLLDQGRPFLPGEVARVGLSLCAAVQAAHNIGVIHRAIQPANVLLDGAGRVKLIDFGMARLSTLNAISTEGMVLGNWCYLSPEQFAGSPEGPAPSMDVFGIGATLYHLVTGRPPYSRGKGLLRHRGPPVEEFAPKLPEPLRKVVSRALKEHPAERFATPNEMVSLLKQAM